MCTKREIRNILRRELKQYEASVGALTPDERKALHQWVADGNSVYENPCWFAGENGNPLCYIEAVRLGADMLSHSENYNF
jgi:hypothetical protein